MSDYPKRRTILLHLRMDDQLFTGIIDECKRLGWGVINLTYTSDYVPAGRDYVGAIIDDSLSGVALDHLLNLDIPIVLGSEDERAMLSGVPRILKDCRAIGQMAVNTLAARGFSDLGFVEFASAQGDDGLYGGICAGVQERDGCRLHLCQVEDGAESEDPTKKYERHVKIISEWIKRAPMPFAVIAFNHRMGARIITASEMAGFSVPEQVAVLAAGNHPSFCETAPVPLTAIDTNQEQCGRELVRQVKRLSDGEPPPKAPVVIPPVGVVERRSTDILAVENAMVATAIRFMWDNLTWPISVDDVAMQVGTSRTTIERAFRKSLGRGVIGELRRKRLELCKELLRGSDMTIAEITKAIGLNDKRYLYRAFKEAFGETPRQYRIRGKRSSA